VLLATGLVPAQQDSGSNQQGDGKPASESEQLGKLPTLEREPFGLKKAAAEKQVKSVETAQKANEKEKELAKATADLAGLRPSTQSPADYAARQRQQAQAVKQLEKEYQKLRSQADIAALQHNEAADALQRFSRSYSKVSLPDWASRRIAEIEKGAVPAAPQQPKRPLVFGTGPVFEQLKEAERRGSAGGTVIDGSRATSGRGRTATARPRSASRSPSASSCAVGSASRGPSLAKTPLRVHSTRTKDHNQAWRSDHHCHCGHYRSQTRGCHLSLVRRLDRNVDPDHALGQAC
jgi:hypothetical protein